MYEPNKNLGQNFLTDNTIVQTFVNAAELNVDDFVLEIGPGLGIITYEIANRLWGENSKLYAVDIDSRFVEKLNEHFWDRLNVTVLEADILKWYPEFDFPRPYKLIGSLPYYITSPILHTIAKKKSKPEIAVILIQKEVAEKLLLGEPASSYISSFLRTFFSIEKIMVVPSDYFTPKPKVDGMIIKLIKKQDPLISHEEIDKYEGFLHRAYSNPRKMLNKIFSKEEISKANINPNHRAQNYDENSWPQIFHTLMR